MNDDQLRTLLRSRVENLYADPSVAERAWRTAREQNRRQRFAAVAGAGAAAALVTVVLAQSSSFDRSAPPATGTVSSPAGRVSTSTPPGPDGETLSERLKRISQPAWDGVKVAALPIIDTKLPSTLDPWGRPAPALTDDPVRTALAVAQRSGPSLDIRILGDDSRWRQLDTPGLEPGRRDGLVVSLTKGSPISPDGTMLALPLPGALLVIDLTSGSARRINLPAGNVPSWAGRVAQWSPDGTEIMTGPASWPGLFRPRHGWLVDLATGNVLPAPFDPTQAAFGPDGSVVELRNWDCGLCQLWHYNGRRVSQRVTLDVQLYVVTPSVRAVMAVSRSVRSWVGRKGVDDQEGILVVDPGSGELLAELPMRQPHVAENATILGWLDDETVVLSVADPTSVNYRPVLVAWNYKSGQLSQLTDRSSPGVDFSLALAVRRLR